MWKGSMYRYLKTNNNRFIAGYVFGETNTENVLCTVSGQIGVHSPNALMSDMLDFLSRYYRKGLLLENYYLG